MAGPRIQTQAGGARLASTAYMLKRRIFPLTARSELSQLQKKARFLAEEIKGLSNALQDAATKRQTTRMGKVAKAKRSKIEAYKEHVKKLVKAELGELGDQAQSLRRAGNTQGLKQALAQIRLKREELAKLE